MKKILILVLVLFVGNLTGCVGSPIHSTVKYMSKNSDISDNNENLLLLNIGKSKVETKKVLGDPERSEGYKWGSVWLYRTAMTSGIYGTADTDYTPVVFDGNGKLIGWGRNFFQDQVKKYDLTVRSGSL